MMMLSSTVEIFQESGFGDPTLNLSLDDDDENNDDELNPQNLPSTDTTSDDDVNLTDTDDEEYL